MLLVLSKKLVRGGTFRILTDIDGTRVAGNLSRTPARAGLQVFPSKGKDTIFRRTGAIPNSYPTESLRLSCSHSNTNVLNWRCKG